MEGRLHAPRREPFRNASSQEASAFDLALFSGGDERVFLDPATGRTKYGTPRGPAEDEIWLSSSTASAISPRGYAAASATWLNLVSGKQTLSGCCDGVRNALLRLFGIDGAAAVLAGSGTEASLIATAIASRLLGPRLTAIVVGCAETGRGIRYAAEGRHFLHHATFDDVTPGAHLDGMQRADIAVETVEIRDRHGALHAMSEIDAELTAKAEAARRAHRAVVIHRLDGSKTGQSGPSFDCLAELCARWPDQLLVLADCCQLRSTDEHIKSLLARGFIVTLTGSKFAGGPSFCGALLLPSEIAEKLASQHLPAGLSAYSAQLDWPSALRKSVAGTVLPAANIGLALRWHAALAEIDRFFALPTDLRDGLLERFHQAAVAEAAHAAGVALLPSATPDTGFGETIVTFVLRRPDGSTLDMEAAAGLQRRLRSEGFHLGQPVEIGGAGALRLCASMALINRLADKIAAGTTTPATLAPIHAAISALFRRIETLLSA
jgi:hypothetical protein